MTCPWLDIDEKGSGLQLEQFLSFHVTRLASSLQRLASREYLEPEGLTAPEWRILGFVRIHGPVRFSRVTEVTALDKAQVSRSVKRLQALGLVEIDSDAEHAQRLVLSVAPIGRKTYARILERGARLQARLLRELPQEQRAALWAALQTLSHASGTAAPETSNKTRRQR